MTKTLRTIPVEADLLARVLAPYKEECRYLSDAVVEVPPEGADHLVRLEGDLSIPFSCYIDDTGHFNSVEFNLCYNQLIYVLMAQCVVSDLLPEFARMTLSEYLARQLPDVLIHDFASKFRRPVDTSRFRGTVEIATVNERSKFLLVRTRCAFEDGAGGSARGDVTLAIVDRSAGKGERRGARRTSGRT